MENKNPVTPKNIEKEIVVQNIKIVLCGIVALVMLVLAILEFATAGSSELKVDEQIKVSSSLVSVNEESYICAISGSFCNTGKEMLTVEQIEIEVKAGKETKRVKLDSFVCPPNTSRDISYTWQDNTAFERVSRVSVTVNGAEDVLVNTSNASSVSGIAIFYLILFAVAVLLLVRACKIRYYMHQEKLMESQQ